MGRVVRAALGCLLLCCAFSASIARGQTAVEKVSPRLRERALGQDRVPVFVVLADQPQQELIESVRAAMAADLDAASESIQTAVGRLIQVPDEMRQARARLDRLKVSLREGAVRQIDLAIGPGQDAMTAKLAGLGATGVRRYSIVNMLAADIPSSAIAALEADPAVAHIFASESRNPHLVNSVKAMGVPAFWSAGDTGAGQSIAVIDSGLNTGHPAFTGVNVISQIFLTSAVKESCFADQANSSLDYLGHGTAVAGVIASQGAPGAWTSYQGVAKGLSTLYNLKAGYVCNASGRSGASEDQDVISALNWAVTHSPVDIFNYSYGGLPTGDDDSFARTLDQIIDTWGVTIVVSAGNFDSQNNPANVVQSPGIAYNVITAANWDTGGLADNSHLAIAGSSSLGPTAGGRYKPDLAAPGSSINLPQYDMTTGLGTFVPWSGTSFSSPHVAGAMGLLMATPGMNSLAAKAILLNTADHPNGGWQTDRGWGYVNLTRAQPQLASAFTGAVGPAQAKFFHGSAVGPVQSTLVWKRHVGLPSRSQFSNLNLYLYDSTTGSVSSSSAATLQNVEQVTGMVAGGVIKVKGFALNSAISSETFGLAISASGFAAAAGPALTATCSGPGSALAGSSMVVSCTVMNTGDLTSFGVQGPLNFSGATGGVVNTFGNIPPGGSATRSWNIAVPSTIGSFTLNASLSSLSYEETFSAPASFTSASVSASTARIGSPVASTVLPGPSVSFVWNASGASAYWLDVGTVQGQGNLFGANLGTNTTQIVNDLPTDGRAIYVRLWSLLSGVWQGNDYIYTAATIPKAAMQSPSPGATLGGGTVTFTWTGSGAPAYWLDVGTVAGQGNLYGANVGTNLSQTVSAIPTDGRTIFVRLWSLANGSWISNDYTYTAAAQSPNSVLQSPVPGSVLAGSSIRFAWSSTGASAYWLDVGTVAGQGNVFGANVGTATAQTVNGIPTDGRTIYVRLWSLINGVWQSNSYTYAAASIAKAAMQSPVQGAVLGGSTVPFTWSSVGAAAYWLDVGTTVGQGDIFGANLATATTRTVTGIPTDGRTIYVRLWSLIAGIWQPADYSYKAASLTPKATLQSPSAGTVLRGGAATFTWNDTGAAAYWLDVGIDPGQGSLFGANVGRNTSQTVNGLPTDGRVVFVRLWSLIAGTWQYNDYSFGSAP